MAPRTLLVTRPQPQADEWVARLAALGVEARALPLLAIDDAPDAAAVAAAWAGLDRRALAMFVSPNAALRFFAARPAGTTAAWPGATLAAGTGPGTRRVLEGAGVPPASIVVPDEAAGQFDSEALWRVLGPRRDWRGASALIVRGDGGREWLADALRAHGASVDAVAAYRRVAPVSDDGMRAALRDAAARPDAFVWHFSSSEAVGHLGSLMMQAHGAAPGRAGAPPAGWCRAPALATHPRITQAVRDAGFADVREVAPTPRAAAGALAALAPSGTAR